MIDLSRFKPRFWDHQDVAAGPGDRHFSFRRKWLMTVVDYRLTRQTFNAEATMGISRMVSNTWRSVSHLLAQRRAALEFISRDNSLAKLMVPQRLQAILANLQSGMGDFVDLEVLDATCTMQAYAGPYDVKPQRPTPATGFDQAVANGFFISDVTAKTGQPHQLVVAIRHDLAQDGFLVLRSTLDASLLDGPLSQLTLDQGDDAFIVNTRGILQTSARHYGEPFSEVPLTIPPTDKGTQVVRAVDQAGRAVLIGVASIADSPFRLVIVRQDSGVMDLWFKPRIRLIGFLGFSIVLIMVSILGMATYMVNRIHAFIRWNMPTSWYPSVAWPRAWPMRSTTRWRSSTRRPG
jgi:two-component system NtrC family sensor kinase